MNGALRMVRGSDGNAYGHDQNGNRSYWLG